MKKLFFLYALIISLNCFSQAIKVDTQKYTIPQLVNTVLINTPCISASNITSKTGTNLGPSESWNGIGYFENTNPNFPMKSGVILSTGDVKNAVGPNTPLPLNDGSASWPGDTDLENTMAQSGISMTSTNATILEFDFMPTSTHFSFDFLFASEEYGKFQCNFSDAFAFLLTNKSTNVTTNLAVVPNTTSPISVGTIRDFLYNSSCPSANAEYFGSYNGGSAASNAAINFNGQTKLMNASANLILNTLYHIKLVIADGKDFSSDSAIFIASDSFNIGQDVLGQDITLVNKNALCKGETYVLNSGLNQADYNISWTKNGNPILGENGSSLTITQSGVYAITYDKKTSVCLPITDEIKIEYLPETVTKNPINLSKCNTGASSYTYDLSINTAIVKTNLDPLTKVSYHASQSDADNNIKPLPLSFSSNGNQTIYVRINIPNEKCLVIKNFKLGLAPSPTAYKPKDLLKCVNTNTALFNLTTQNKDILNGQSPLTYIVKYYKSLDDATNNKNEIIKSANYSSGNSVVYARVQHISDSSCFSTTNFSLIINPIPPVDKIANVLTCDSYTLKALTNGNYFSGPDGEGTKYPVGHEIKQSQTVFIFNQPNGPSGCSASSSFEVKIIDPLELSPKDGKYCGSFTLPPLELGDYYTVPGGNGAKLDPGTSITKSQKLYYYFKSSAPPYCVIDTDFDVTILPEIILDKTENVFDCTSYTLPALRNGNYFTELDGKGTPLNAGDPITTTQTIYIYAINPEGCVSQNSFDVIIGIEIPKDISQCEPYTLPPLPMGNYYTGPKGTGQKIEQGTVINLTQTIYIYVPTKNAPNCTDDIHFNIAIAQPIIDILTDVTECGSYTLPNLVSGEYFTGPEGTGDIIKAGDIIYSSQTVYIYKKSSFSDCFNQVKFEVTVIPKPLINSRADVVNCNFYTLTDLEYGNYYTGPKGTGNMLAPGTIITTSQDIYIYASSNDDPECFSEENFNITIYLIQADAPKDVIACESHILDPLKSGNYYTQSGGPSNGNAILMHAGDKISSSTTLYVYAESGERINCTDEHPFNIKIVDAPVVFPIPDTLTTVCDEDEINDGLFDFNLTQLNATVLGTTQTGPEFKVEYFATEEDALTGVNPITTTDLKTVYVKVSNTLSSNCFDLESFNITVNQLPETKPLDGIICYDSKTNTLLKSYTIHSGLDTSTHTIQWMNEAGDVVGNDTNYEVLLPETYTLIAKSNLTGCESKPIPVVVSPSEPAVVAYTLSEDFSNNPIITVIATGTGGNYEYMLDSGAFQDSPIFENVASGTHTITVRDKNGCGSSTTEALIVHYPKFFTPNDDGYNDTWNIEDLKDQSDAVIQIYDRYGKLLKVIKPNSPGWDGNYGGQKMPSTDYWFIIFYEKDGIQKKFKSHFTLKR